jgi:hypothetical protein
VAEEKRHEFARSSENKAMTEIQAELAGGLEQRVPVGAAELREAAWSHSWTKSMPLEELCDDLDLNILLLVSTTQSVHLPWRAIVSSI